MKFDQIGQRIEIRNWAIYDIKKDNSIANPRNLTQSSLRNDLINRRMHGFSFCVFEDEIEVQDVISPRSLNQILISRTPWTRKRVKNAKKSIGTRIVVSIQFGYLENSRAVFSVEEQVNLKEILGVIVDLTDSSRSTVAMRHLLIKSS